MLIIFDCDGVILDSMPLHSQVEASAYNEINIEITAEELARRFSGISQKQVSKTLAEETGVNIPINFNKIIEEKKQLVFSEKIKAVPYVSKMLEDISGIPSCIASGSGFNNLKLMLGAVKLYDYFAPHIYSSEMVENGKPFPDLFLHAASQMQKQPNECIVIEDSIAGIEAAVRANMRSFGFTGGSHCGHNLEEQLKKSGAELVFSDMRELLSAINKYLE